MGRRKTKSAPTAREASGDTTELDTGLDQQRLRHQEVIAELLLERLPVTIFEYDTVTDRMEYTVMNAQKVQEHRAIPHFRTYLAEHDGDSDVQQTVLLPIFNRETGPDPQGTIEYSAKFEKKEYAWYRSSYRRLRDQDGHVWVVGYTENINAEVQARRRLTDDAVRDSLTKLYNRETTERLINDEIALLRSGEKGVLLYLDMDNFGQINERFGRTSGDGYLRSVTDTLRSDFRDVDIFGRVGGDEFVVFFKGFLSIDVIEKRAQHIVDLFMHVQVENFNTISCSIGVAVTGSTTDTFAMLMPKSEKALTEAKRRGKNRYRMYDDEHY